MWLFSSMQQGERKGKKKGVVMRGALETKRPRFHVTVVSYQSVTDLRPVAKFI